MVDCNVMWAGICMFFIFISFFAGVYWGRKRLEEQAEEMEDPPKY